MKRVSSLVVAAALALSSFPASAQVALRVSIETAGAPALVPQSFVPVAGAFAPALSAPSLGLTPSLSAALAPMPGIVLAEPVSALKPSLVVATPQIPGLPVVSKPDLRPSRPVVATPGAAPLEALDRVATEGGRVIDGSALHAAATPEEPGAPEPAASPAKKPGLLARYREHRNKPSTPFQTFGKVATLTALAATLAPVAVSAAPAMKAAFLFIATGALMMALLIPAGIVVWAVSRLRRAPQTASKPPPARRAKAALLGAALALGLAAGAVPHYATAPLVEFGSAVYDTRLPAAEKNHVRRVSGDALPSETVKVLSANPIGRATLDALRDRFGALHLPDFYVSSQSDSVAQHEGFFDGLYIAESEITGRGWTVERFLDDPKLQREFIRANSDTITHELTHAVQSRRAPWNPGYFRQTFEAEREAYFQEARYRIAAFLQDPAAKLDGSSVWLVLDGDIDSYLAEMTSGPSYKDNVVQGNDPIYNRWMAEQKASFPALRVRVLLELARRAPAAGSAKMYLDKAKTAAADAGLPAPQALPGTPSK